MDAEFDSASNEYPHCILLTDPATPKIRNTWKKKCDDDVIITFFQVFLVFGVASSHFSGIYCFWGSRVRQKYAVWVLVGCGIKFRIQRALFDQNLSKNTGRYVENTNTKNSFFLSSSKINQYYFIILTIILLF